MRSNITYHFAIYIAGSLVILYQHIPHAVWYEACCMVCYYHTNQIRSGYHTAETMVQQSLLSS